MSDDLTVFGTDYVDVTGIKARGTGNGLLTFFRPTGTKSISANGTGIDVAAYANVDVAVPSSVPSLQSKTKSYTPTETAQSETVSADSGYDGLSSVDISVGAISSSYVGSGVTRRSSSDLTASGPTVTVPPGYYSSSAQKAVSNGTEGTPVATKGTVSNHQVSVTPSVTNSAGYILGTTKTGTAVTVSVSELASGTKSINANGTGIDVAQYASVDVSVPEGAFVVTLSYNDQTEKWEPDCSYAEVAAAYTSEKVISIMADDSSVIADGYYEDTNEVLIYQLYNSLDSPIIYQQYELSQSGLTLIYSEEVVGKFFASPSVSYTPTESQQTDVITYDQDYYSGIEQVNVTVGAISSTYVGSGITQRSSTDLTASGATVSVPSGYYASAASKSITSGSAGTPTATKGTVSNHAISVTPSVTNTTGYIEGGTKTGTAVSVAASELVSGTKSISANGTGIDVTNYSAVDVAVPAPSPALQTVTKSYTPTESAQTDTVTPGAGYDGIGEVDISVGAISSTYVGSGITQRSSTDLTASEDTVSVPAGYYVEAASKAVSSGTVNTPTATKGTVSNHSISVTPSVNVYPGGYISSGVRNGTAVSVSASELVSGTYTVDSSGTKDVTNYASVSVPAGSATIDLTIDDFAPSTITVSNSGLITATNNGGSLVTPDVVPGYVSEGTEGEINISGSATKQLFTQAAKTVTPTESEQTAVSTGCYTTGTVKVGAISSTYVGSGISQRSSTDLTASGATVSVPAGYYSEQASKSVASGSAGTPTATKGTVSNNAVSVTPSVTNTTGYITGGTKTGTAVTVSASELVSGTKSITASGTTDVTNYASASVAAGSVTASASKSVRNNVATVTPSETRTAGWVAAGSTNGTVVTVSASELVSGSETKTANGTYDVTNLASLVVAVPYSTIYSGTLSPSSSQGSNGDVYLKTVS